MVGGNLAERKQTNGVQNLLLVSDLDIDKDSKIPANPKGFQEPFRAHASNFQLYLHIRHAPA